MSRLGRIRHYVTETLLWLAAALGLITILLVVCANLFNTSIILFRTGSMEPTIPAGSAALVREIPASEIAVGDVLTVDRPGRLPVTHRVTEVQPGESSNERIITMQGDANESPDPAPYTVTEARVLLASLPGLANPINRLGDPYVLGGVTLAAALLVGWAFWPRNTDTTSASTQQHRAVEEPSDHTLSVVGIIAIGATLLVPSGGQAFASPSEHPADNIVEESINSTYISLTSVYDPSSRQQLAVDSASAWDVGIDIEAPTQGQARTGLRASGAFPLHVTVLACPSRWATLPTFEASAVPECADGHRVVAQDLRVLPDEDVLWIDEFPSEQTHWLRLNVALPDGIENPGVDTVSLQVHVHAHGDEVSTGTDLDTAPSPEDTLAQTGFSVLFLVLVAVGSVGIGGWLRTRRRQRADYLRGDIS